MGLRAGQGQGGDRDWDGAGGWGGLGMCRAWVMSTASISVLGLGWLVSSTHTQMPPSKSQHSLAPNPPLALQAQAWKYLFTGRAAAGLVNHRR